MPRPVYIAMGTTGTYGPVPMDNYQTPFNASFAVEIVATGTAAGTAGYSVQFTLDNVFDSNATITWQNDANLGTGTTTNAGNYMFPVRAIRCILGTLAAATGTFAVLQGSPP